MPVSISNLTAAWANSQNTYTAIGFDVTDSGSAADSKLLRLTVNGQERLTEYANGDLYISGTFHGSGFSGSNVAGAYNQANTAYLVANAAFDRANAATSGADIPAGIRANAAFLTANAAFAKANIANSIADAAFAKANVAGDVAGIIANAAFGKANTAGDTAGIIANAAFAQANTASGDAAGIIANAAFVTANAAFNKANTSSGGDTAGLIANAAFAKANTASDTAGIIANGAFTQANTANFRAIGAFAKANVAGDVAGIIANAAFTKANTAGDVVGVTANAAFAKANIANSTADAAFGQANLANSFSQNGTGAVVRTSQDKARDVFHARDFGAKFDGTTNDYNAMVAAIAALSAAGGGTLIMPAGNARIYTGNLDIPSNVSLQGQGVATILNFEGTTSGSGLRINNTNNIVLRDFYVTAAFNHGISIEGASPHSIIIDNVITSFNGAAGLNVDNAYTSSFRRVFARNNGTFGIYVPGYSTSLTFVQCSCSTNIDSGWYLRDLTYSSLVGCSSDDNSDYGYQLYNVSGIDFSGCGAETNAKGAILASASDAIASGAIVPDIKGVTFTGFFAYNNGASETYYSSFLEASSLNSRTIEIVLIGCRDFTSPNDLSILANGATEIRKIGGTFAGTFSLTSPAVLYDVTQATNAAYTQANTAYMVANAAFAQANSAAAGGDIPAGIRANAAFGQANIAFLVANAAFNKANIGGGASVAVSDDPPPAPTANSLWWNSNTGKLLIYYNDGDTSQWIDAAGIEYSFNASTANGDTAGIIANAAFARANTACTSADLIGVYANAAFAKANTTADVAGIRANAAFSQANVAYIVANAAFDKANIGGGASVAVSDQFPPGSTANSLWWNSNTGKLLIYYNDGDTTQWVDAAGIGRGENLSFLQAGTGAVPRTWQSKARDIICVFDFMATNIVADVLAGTVSLDCSTAIQAAIDHLEANGGGKLQFPAGRYLLSAGLTIERGGISLCGVGWEEFVGEAGSTTPSTRGYGTWFYWTNGDISPITLTHGGGNTVTIEDIAFEQQQPAITGGWTPTAYAPAITVLADGTNLRRLYFFGIYAGIDIGTEEVATGRTIMEDIWGEFFNFGIRVQYSADVIRLCNYHQYPFWSLLTANVAAFTQATTFGIMLYKCDNPQLSNIFVGGCSRGLYIGSNAAGTTGNLTMTNFDFDFTDTGIMIATDSATLWLANGGTQPGPNEEMVNSRSIYIDGSSNRVALTNFRSARTNRESIFVGGTNNIIGLSNYDVNMWDEQLGNVLTAIYSASSTNKISLSGQIHYVPNGTTAPFLGGSLESYQWPQFAGGTVNDTADGSGDITVTHNLGWTPNFIDIQMTTNYWYLLNAHTIGATSFKVRVLNSDTTSAATGAAVAFNYKLSM